MPVPTKTFEENDAGKDRHIRMRGSKFLTRTRQTRHAQRIRSVLSPYQNFINTDLLLLKIRCGTYQ